MLTNSFKSPIEKILRFLSQILKCNIISDKSCRILITLYHRVTRRHENSGFVPNLAPMSRSPQQCLSGLLCVFVCVLYSINIINNEKNGEIIFLSPPPLFPPWRQEFRCRQ